MLKDQLDSDRIDIIKKARCETKKVLEMDIALSAGIYHPPLPEDKLDLAPAK